MYRQDNDSISLASGQMLGRYRVLRRIEKGCMGEVWLAEGPSLHRQVAIERLPVHSQRDREFSLRFTHEAQAVAALNHPHILPIHDFGEQPLPNGQSIAYIVMPYISGGSLGDTIARYTAQNRDMPAEEALLYLKQVAEAIDYAHSQGKTEAASDIYSLAVIAYQLFTGHLPFTSDTNYESDTEHRSASLPSPRTYNPSLSPASEAVLLQGLAEEPQQRFASAQAFVAALQSTLDNAAFELTHSTSGLPETLEIPEDTHEGRLSDTFEYSSDIAQLQEKQASITRRQLLIGGGAAGILALGGATLAIIANTHTHSQVQSRPHIQSSPHVQSTPTTNNTITPTSTPTPAPALGDPTLVLLGHTKPVTSLSWSPKANTLVSASTEKDIFTWNIEALAQQKGQTLLPFARLALDAQNDSPDTLVAWSPNGSAIAIANALLDSSLLDPNTLDSPLICAYQKDLHTPLLQKYNALDLGSDDIPTIDALGWVLNTYIVKEKDIS